MRAYVGVTDGDWYRFLAERPNLQEVNFWRPSSKQAFHAVQIGEPFFFKTHHPHNRVVGGGFFSGFARLPISTAWELYGEGNGAAGLHQMREDIGRYRREPIPLHEDPDIGCLFIRDTRFFEPDAIAGPPPDFASNIVQGKGYDLAESGSARYFLDLFHRLTGTDFEIDLSAPWHRGGPVYGDPRLRPQRLGQQAFQGVVLDAYHRRCAITGAKIRPVLQAAHILPLPNGGEHRLDNGLLLRSDVHIMFDRGYLSIDPSYRLLVSPRLRADFGNGEEFYSRSGEQIAVPERKPDRPNREFLEWHVETMFKAA
ncbi:HNH endonuclease [Dactylosporangium sp. NPDC006015]|uniref:HNH endonuclease n=1 Tax=Dactylosporangium sp. NPDC006015 TaxID=3154576 RepID=UPI0033B91EA3